MPVETSFERRGGEPSRLVGGDGPPSAAPELSLELRPGRGSVAELRRSLASLPGRPCSVLLEHVAVIVDELVSHAGAAARPGEAPAAVRLRVWLDAGAVRAEVSCASFAVDGSAGPCFDSIAGRGLGLVERLADRWGVRQERPLVIWFELGRGAPEEGDLGARAPGS